MREQYATRFNSCMKCRALPWGEIELCALHHAAYALLVVAKQAAKEWDDFDRLKGPLAALDTEHLGWREWMT